MATRELDVVIFGGGAAGLWLLDTLIRAGYRTVLLESESLGSGQTVASQGIIHGGLKYTLDGMFNRSADAVRAMPDLWRDCLAGKATPHLTETRVRAEACHLWRTDSFRSRLGMVGARQGLQVRPERLDPRQRPDVLRDCPGDVFLLAEPVICPQSFIADLFAQHRTRCLKYATDTLRFEQDAAGNVTGIEIHDAWIGQTLTLRPRAVVLAAGRGNVPLRTQLGLSTEPTQERPLHMAMLRGALPVLNGHCVDGARTRVTITTTSDAGGRTVWQVGGQVAEDGVRQESITLLRHVRAELAECLPGIDWNGVEWSSYRVSRSEGRTGGGRRPDHEVALRDANIWSAWPTKLALAPRLANLVLEQLPAPRAAAGDLQILDGWARPAVADPPWDSEATWHRDL